MSEYPQLQYSYYDEIEHFFMKILLVDDNRDLAASLADFLEEKGYEMDFAFSGASALELVINDVYDVIILDVMMPGIDGLKTCQLLRESLHVATPIIFLTARDTLEDKLAGFQVGADDYLVKPFAPEELECRIQALVLRGVRTNIGKQEFGPLSIDFSRQEVTREGQVITLNSTQINMLRLLIQKSPQTVSREQLESAMWESGTPDSDPLRTHIYRLRIAIDKPFETHLIETVYGKGYRLTPQ